MIDWMLCSATDPHSPAQHRPSIRARWCGRLKRRIQCPVNCEAGQLSGLETSELSPPDRNSSTCSSPFPPSKRKSTYKHTTTLVLKERYASN
ncbi:hypothetical protein JOQ06_029299 [Pogonophryne albipinna]|uniref:Uncharacterized protein n=1 Tax=Pogonophryne albipinna TaxID=1090488 RepID=A0AAD6BBS9_9TELE|nr:hypothetical protein JOQ06_029299 [Pogonophryne albipinna]